MTGDLPAGVRPGTSSTQSEPTSISYARVHHWNEAGHAARTERRILAVQGVHMQEESRHGSAASNPLHRACP